MMLLDCVSARDIGGKRGWVIINKTTGGIVAHADDDDCSLAWMAAANKLADTLSAIQRTIYEADWESR